MDEKTRMYQLYELRDNLQEGIANYIALEKDERKLVDLIERSGEADTYKDFIKGLSDNWPKYTNQNKILQDRIDRLNEILSLYEKQDAVGKLVETIVTKLLEALGSVENYRS